MAEQPEEFERCCDVNFKSKAHEYCEIVLMVLMLVSGLVTMVYTIITIAEKK